jgi:hypothetical protein
LRIGIWSLEFAWFPNLPGFLWDRDRGVRR